MLLRFRTRLYTPLGTPLKQSKKHHIITLVCCCCLFAVWENAWEWVNVFLSFCVGISMDTVVLTKPSNYMCEVRTTDSRSHGLYY
jgi:uncharacterized membrane protein YbaN (DUF454 family)